MGLTVTISIYDTNRMKILNRTITKLLKEEIKFEEILIVVGDANDIENCNELLQQINSTFHHPKLNVVHNQGKGLSMARNTAINYCKSEYLAFLDDDAIPTESWFKNIDLLFLNELEMFAGKIQPLYMRKNLILPNELNWIVGCTFPPVYDEKTNHLVRNPIGANMVFKLKSLRDAGGFGNQFGRQNGKLISAEETDVATTIANQGGKCLYIPNLKVMHVVPPERSRIQYVIRRSFYEGYSKSIYNSKKSIENKNQGDSALNVEKNYLFALIKKIFNIRKINESLLFLTVIFFVTIGYISGFKESFDKQN